MATSLQFTADDVVFTPVTDAKEIPELVDLCMRALEPDPLVEWINLYTEHTERGSTTIALNEAINDPKCSIIKAVVPPRCEGEQEILVGFTNWVCGYIELDKVDPFAPKNEPAKTEMNDTKDIADATSSLAEELRDKAEHLQASKLRNAEDEERARKLKFGESIFIDSRNYYIMAIRGKKHLYIRRIMVDPEYQRRGIAAKLLKHITDEADRQKIVCWLFSRPAGEALYRKNGFQDIRVTEMSDGDLFQCPRVIGMMRPRNE